MLNENIKALRKIKGFTQDELASRLNVVRQTVSKWEKGYSVPDAEMLQRIAEIFETDVSHLLGNPIEENSNSDIVAEQLARINEQLVIKNRRSRKLWKTIGIVFLIIIIVQLLLVISSVLVWDNYKVNTDTYIEEYNEEIIEE